VCLKIRPTCNLISQPSSFRASQSYLDAAPLYDCKRVLKPAIGAVGLADRYSIRPTSALSEPSTPAPVVRVLERRARWTVLCSPLLGAVPRPPCAGPGKSPHNRSRNEEISRNIFFPWPRPIHTSSRGLLEREAHASPVQSRTTRVNSRSSRPQPLLGAGSDALVHCCPCAFGGVMETTPPLVTGAWAAGSARCPLSRGPPPASGNVKLARQRG